MWVAVFCSCSLLYDCEFLGDLDHHLQAAGQGDFGGATEGGGAEASCAADDGADACAFASAEDGSEECAGTSADAGADEGGATLATGEDCVFDADGFAGGCVEELDDLGLDASGAAVGHDEAVELENHFSVAGEAAGQVDVADVAVDAGSLIGSLDDD